MEARKQWRGNALKLVDIASKWLGMILLLALGLYAVIVAINLFDEELTSGTVTLLKPEERSVPDNQNAYLALVGFDASAEEKPERLGRARLSGDGTARERPPIQVLHEA